MTTLEVGLRFASACAVLGAPLLLAALGELVSERAGVLNVGVEGLMLGGCFGTFAVAHATQSPGAAVVVAVATGVVLAALFALVAVVLRADAVVTGTALNLLVAGATASLYRDHFGDAGSAVLVPGIPKLLLPAGALVLVPLIAVFLGRTRPGLLLRACGEDAHAARAVGIPVVRVQMLAVLFGGALAGLAGAQLVLAQAQTFVEEMTAGRGFIALAVVICGRWRARGTLAAAALFGAVTALQFQLQAAGSRIPYQLFLALPYVATLVVLAAMARRR